MSKKLEIVLVVILIIFLGFLRFYNLGHSEYIPDEITVMEPLKDRGSYSSEFFLNQRKGPMQFLVAYIPFMFHKDIFSEGFYRIPFAFANSLSFLFLYLFVRNISGRKLVALLSTFLIGVCGFTVGLGRIIQYQSLNMLLSFMSLYFYSLLLVRGEKYIQHSLLGTAFFCLSIFSHWDAVLYFPVMIWIFRKFLMNSNISRHLKIKSIVMNSVFVLLSLLPFIVPYIKGMSESNIDYFSTRVGLGGENNTLIEKLSEYKFKIGLYNPFVYTGVVIFGYLLSFLEFKKFKVIHLWFWTSLLIFLFFIKHAGTHIYNLLIPLSILSSYGLVVLLDSFRNWWKIPAVLFVALTFAFLYYQSFLLFADVSTEYPFRQEIILGNETQRYTHKDLTNNLIGFPMRRGWVEISKYMNSVDNPRYITNEDKTIASFYVNGVYGEGSGIHYAVGVKYPLSFSNDYSFSQIRGKHTVYEAKVNGSVTARIYLVDGKK